MSPKDQPDGEVLSVTPSGLRALLEHVGEVIICCDGDGTIRFANEAFRTMLGYAPELFKGRNIIEIIHEDHVSEIIDGLARWNGRTGAPLGEAIKVIAADGTDVAVHYDIASGNDFGDFGSLIITARVESAVEHAERQLRARAINDDRIMRLSTAFLNLPTDAFNKGLEMAVAELSSLENVTRVSVWRMLDDRLVRQQSWQAVANAPTVKLSRRIRPTDFASVMAAAQGHDVLMTEPWIHGPEFERDHRVFTSGGVTSALISPMHAGDEFVGVVMLESTLADGFGATHVGAIHTACAILAEAFLRNDAERLLAQHANVDRVTGLANRWAFDVELECALEDLRSGALGGLALALVDLDRFKVVNDTYGHAVGDHLLAEAALRLRRNADGNTLVARLGGDEILVLVKDVAEPDDAVQVIEQLLGAFELPFLLPSGAINLTASTGVAHTCDGDTEMSELMNRADVAMYRVKSQGGDSVTLAEADSHIQRSQRLRRETDLNRAIQAGTLRVYFQPEYELATGKLLGAEALVRWQHPRDGLLSAAEFVPLIESSGLVERMGRQVLREACETWAGWGDKMNGESLVLRVNVAARQLRLDDFVYQVADAVNDAGLPATSLCLELTESTLLADPTVAAARFDALRKVGVGLAVDDFGTGYSSYLQLRSLPLTALKVDRSFVTDLPTSHTDRAIVAATLQMATALGLTVTAEGVETEAQREVLIELGCPSAQGYLLGRPMPAKDFVKLFESA